MPNKARTPCTFPGCGWPAVDRGRCQKHKRGTTSERGYDGRHKRTRAAYEFAVTLGRVRCARCGLPIKPGDKWDLGHNDRDRRKYNGPEHADCNRAAGGRSN